MQSPEVALDPQTRVAVVHDYLTQFGGSERVALAMVQAMPGARLITSCYSPDRTSPSSPSTPSRRRG